MELIKLNLEQWPGPSPAEACAERVGRPIGTATDVEIEEAIDPLQQVVVPAGTVQQPEACVTAPDAVKCEEPLSCSREQADVASSSPVTESHLTPPATFVARLSSLLETPAAIADPAEQARLLSQRYAIPIDLPTRVDLPPAAPTTVINRELPGMMMPPHDSGSAAISAALEPDFTLGEACVDPEGPSHLLRHDARPASSRVPLEPSFAYGRVSTGLFPARGLFYSVLGHGVAIVALVLLWPKHVPSIYDPPKQWELTMMPKDTLYLPALGGGDSGGPQRGAAAPSQALPSLSVAALSKLGVSFPGPQAIISNPPHPTNKVQTLLQPELPNPPELTQFMRLPNVMRLAENSPAPQPTNAPDAPKAEPSIEPPVPHAGPIAPTIPQLRAMAPVVIENPKLSLPAAAPVSNPAMQTSATPPVAPEPPKPAQARVLPGSSGREARTLIALSVTPGAPDPSPRVPAAEAHGQFAVVALPKLAVSQLGIGSAAESANPAAGAGANPKPSAHDATGTGTLALGTGARPVPGSAGAVAGPGPGAADGGAGRNAAGASGGGMTIRGAAYGSGAGAGSASGAGKGAGPAPGAFAGMTVQGGDWPNGTPAGIAPRTPAKPPESGSYGLTVVSTGNSGSGLGDFGVFYNEPVFTVYISMTTPSGATAPSWTLVYAALHPGESGAEKITSPFPSKKETPAWPIDLADRYRNQLCVVYMVIDESGKVQRVKSMESPNADFIAPLIAALNDWEFRPATLNGKPVAVRGLVGVPISAHGVPTPASTSNAVKTPIAEKDRDPFSRN